MCIGCNSSSTPKNIYKTKVGNAIIWSILDSQTEESTDIFKGNDKLVKETYPNGKYTAYVNFFIIKTPRAISLINSGSGKVNMKDSLSYAGVNLEDVEAIYMTHINKDTAGGLLKGDEPVFSKAKIYISVTEDEELGFKPDDDPNKVIYKKIEKAYGEKITTFRTTGEEMKNGITSLASYGHTIGHTIYKFESKNEVILFLGGAFTDLYLQTKDVKISSTTDEDQEGAISARQDILDLIESEKSLTKCSGIYFPFPAIATIEKVKGNEYKFTLEK